MESSCLLLKMAPYRFICPVATSFLPLTKPESQTGRRQADVAV